MCKLGYVKVQVASALMADDDSHDALLWASRRMSGRPKHLQRLVHGSKLLQRRVQAVDLLGPVLQHARHRRPVLKADSSAIMHSPTFRHMYVLQGVLMFPCKTTACNHNMSCLDRPRRQHN